MRNLFFRQSPTAVVFSGNSLLYNIAAVFCFAMLTAVCAQISFWIGPIPITGQTMSVLFAGLFLGSKRGALSQIIYITVGITGLPFWFAPGGAPGIMRLAGPTGGYLLGFVAMAFVAGWLFETIRTKRIWNSIIAAFVGTVVLYISGLSWLSMYVTADKLLEVGFYPFIIGDLIKIFVVVLSLYPIRFAIGKIINAIIKKE